MGLPHGQVLQRSRPRFFLWPNGKRSGKLDLSSWVASFEFSKTLQNPVGTWSVTLLPFRGSQGPVGIHHPTDLEALARPNAVVSLGFDVGGGICLGLVDAPGRKRHLGGANASRTFTLSGSDMGKVLVSDSIIHASLDKEAADSYGKKIEAVTSTENALLDALTVTGPENAHAGAKTFEGAQIHELVGWVLDAWTTFRIPLLAAMGGSGRAGDFMVPDVTPWNPGQYLYTDAPKSYNGDIYGFIRSLVDEDFFEVIVDSLFPTYPVAAVDAMIPEVRLTVRPKPFDSRMFDDHQIFRPVNTRPDLTWESMANRVDGDPYHQIEQYEILDEDLGTSDADVFSYYEVTSDSDLMGNADRQAAGLFYPLVDLSVLKRAGLRAFRGRLSLVDPDILGKQEDALPSGVLPSDIKEFRNRLFNWYRLAEWFEAGSITVAGRDRFRVGDKVYLPWHRPFRAVPGTPSGCYFYITGTTHRWSVGQPYTTTLRLSRGHSKTVVDAAKAEIAREAVEFGVPGMLADR